MKATNKILSLLHDTLIEKVKFKNNNLILFFYFYLGDTTIEQNEYIVKFNNKNISDISCYEHYRDETKKEIKITEIIDSDCLRIELNKNEIEIIAQKDDGDTIVILTYKSEENILTGNINELKMFWDIPVENLKIA